MVPSRLTDAKKNPFSFTADIAQMLRGGVIIEISTINQAKIAESAGACCIIVSEPRKSGISHMPDPAIVNEIKSYVLIPIIGSCRVGHFMEARILEAIGFEYLGESEVLAIAVEDNFINKHNFRVPFSLLHMTLLLKLSKCLGLMLFTLLLEVVDAALIMQLGCDGVLLGPDVFILAS